MSEANSNQINFCLTGGVIKNLYPEKDQSYFGNGKILLSGEFFVLDGAMALALPTKVGQSLTVKYTPSYSPVLSWKSFDVKGKCWFESKFEFWHFKCLDKNPSEEALFLQKILQQVRKQNSHFLRDEVDVKVETHLGFPLLWGLGSSSSLIYNIAQWAYVSPFDLLFKTHGGSGYDIACAQANGPIAYRKLTNGPHWAPIYFYPSFRKNIYFIYRGKKRNSREAIKDYNKKRPLPHNLISKMTEITLNFINAKTLEQFQTAMTAHEKEVSTFLGMTPVKEELFLDFNGAIKSLGAWGGDFMMAASSDDFETVATFFKSKGFPDVYNYDDLISKPSEEIAKDSFNFTFSNQLIH